MESQLSRLHVVEDDSNRRLYHATAAPYAECKFIVMLATNRQTGAQHHRLKPLPLCGLDKYEQNTTRSQAVARIAARTAPQYTIVCRTRQSNSNGKSKPGLELSGVGG